MQQKAREFAIIKHGTAMRKSNGLPYYTHPIAVATRLLQFPETSINQDIICAAYLHDTLEDTDTTSEEITLKFNETVSKLVQEVTSDKRLIKERQQTDPQAKAKYLTGKINRMSKDARAIKLADREHNVSDLHVCTSEFSTRYANETRYILDHCNVELRGFEREIVHSIWKKITPYL